MARSSLKIRLLALFVVAFVCLNMGGALCVAYCQSFDHSKTEADHCPLKKTSEDCHGPRSKKDDRNSFTESARKLECCPMTVSFFGAPVEKNLYSFGQLLKAAVDQPRLSTPIELSSVRDGSISNYRGPPLIDRRVLRIKNRLLRI